MRYWNSSHWQPAVSDHELQALEIIFWILNGLRPLDKIAHLKNILVISLSKHLLSVLKRIVF